MTDQINIQEIIERIDKWVISDDETTDEALKSAFALICDCKTALLQVSESQTKWYDIDNPPSDKREILLLWPNGKMKIGFYYDGTYYDWPSTSKHALGKIGMSHWAELPQPPKSED